MLTDWPFGWYCFVCHRVCSEWRKGLFWLNLAESLAPHNILVQEQYIKLYELRGDKIALERAKIR